VSQFFEDKEAAESCQALETQMPMDVDKDEPILTPLKLKKKHE